MFPFTGRWPRSPHNLIFSHGIKKKKSHKASMADTVTLRETQRIKAPYNPLLEWEFKLH